MPVSKANLFYPTDYKVSQQFNDPNKGTFRTHRYRAAELLHTISEAVLLPARKATQMFALVIQPQPGAGKEHPWKGKLIRAGALAAGVALIPFALVSAAIGYPLRALDHQFRPAMSCLQKETFENLPVLTKEDPLHIRTHNLGMVSTSMSYATDLRHPVERAREIVEDLNNDPNAPEVVMFQETFHEDAVQVLCEGLKDKYPYIVHSVAPHISGFSSGAMVASKYPLGEIYFERLENALGPEQAAPRGVLRVEVKTMHESIYIYNAHTQALIGEARANARLAQLKQLNKLLKQDKNAGKAYQVLVGDLNTSHINAWGEYNFSTIGEKEQFEQPVLSLLEYKFNDVHRKDHSFTGKRSKGVRMFDDGKEEPTGTWAVGPFADPETFIRKQMKKERDLHGIPDPRRLNNTPKDSLWGTANWKPTANTARFDYVLFPEETPLNGRAEIRWTKTPAGTPSASSDHLPLDAKIWIKKTRTSINGA